MPKTWLLVFLMGSACLAESPILLNVPYPGMHWDDVIQVMRGRSSITL